MAVPQHAPARRPRERRHGRVPLRLGEGVRGDLRTAAGTGGRLARAAGDAGPRLRAAQRFRQGIGQAPNVTWQRQSLNLRELPIGMYGAVMGLVGLGLTARSAATVLPGYVRAPAYVTEPWVALGVIAFLILVPLYVAKLVRYPAPVREEFTNPVQLGFCGALPVGMFLVGGGLAPYWFALANAISWLGFALLLAFQVWALSRWLSGSIDLAHINAGWLIIMVGGIVAPGPGIALGHAEASRFIFGISAAAAPILLALLSPDAENEARGLDR